MTEAQAIDERRRYVTAFNDTMLRIWKEKITLLGVVDTGALYRSVIAVGMRADAKFIDISLTQQFNTYGLFVNYGTGREVYRGNPGDIGRPKVREARPWFSKKYFASVMNLREFLAENIGNDICRVIAQALNPDYMRIQVTT